MPEIQTNNLVDHGQLKIQVTSRQRAVPIPNAAECQYNKDFNMSIYFKAL